MAKQAAEGLLLKDVKPTPPSANGDGPTRTVPRRRLSMDEFGLFVNGEEYRPRVGEWLEVPHTRTIRQARDLEEQLRVLDGETVEAYNSRLWNYIVEHGFLLAWNLTDLATGLPLPQPFADGYVDLSVQELGYITGRIIIGWRDLPPFSTGSEPTPSGSTEGTSPTP